ncbi:MAG: acyltransferase family protein [Muribaculaceae bacterium]
MLDSGVFFYIMSNVRIEIFDFMKGFCIAMVIADHSNLHFDSVHIQNMLDAVRMPLYFFLSGIFFKEYTCYADFALRKTCKLIIPYLFFALIYGVVVTVDKAFGGTFPSACQLKAMIFLPSNAPLWFLRCLFIVYSMYYLLNALVLKRVGSLVQWLTIGIYAFVVWELVDYCNEFKHSSRIVLYLFKYDIFSAAIVLPILFCAHKFRESLTSIINYPIAKLIAVLTVSILLLYYSTTGPLSFAKCQFDASFFSFYISIGCGICGIFALCTILYRLLSGSSLLRPFICEFGRYSLIALGMNWPIRYVLISVGCDNCWLMFAINVAIMPLFSKVLTKYLPYFTAQKDIIKYHKVQNK